MDKSFWFYSLYILFVLGAIYCGVIEQPCFLAICLFLAAGVKIDQFLTSMSDMLYDNTEEDNG